MTDFLRTLFGVSMTGGIFILAAILVRAGAKNRMPKHFLIFLWTAVLAHLLLPVEMPSPASIYNYIAFQRPLVPEREEAPLRERSGPAGKAAIDHPVPGRGDPAGSAGWTGWSAVLPVVWLAGAGILGAGFVLCHRTTGKRFDDAIQLKGDPAVDRWLRGRNRPVRVYVSDRTATPLSYGLLRPRIILPLGFARNDAARVESVLEHEYVHGRQHHNVMKSLVCVAVIAHWFNPLVWLFWLLFNHDLELACDEQALRRIGAHRRADYARSLVAVAERVVMPSPLASAFNARNLRERIVDVMGFKRASGYWLIPEVLLAALLFALFGTAPVPNGKYASSGDIARETELLAEYARLIPMPRAGRLAVDAVGGGEATGVELKRAKSGGVLYEVDVLRRGRKYEVKLDALDGRVVEIDD